MQRFVLSIVLSALALLVLAQPSSAQTTVYFTYYTNSSTFPEVCGTGSLSCTAGSTAGTYTCQSLISGTHNYYGAANRPTISTPYQTTFPATCRGYTPNNLLPLTNTSTQTQNINGINLQYGQTCINMYATRTGFALSPDAVTGNLNFTWSTSQSGVAACPITPIPATSTSTVTVSFVYTIVNAALGAVCGVGNLQCTSYGSNVYVCPTLLGGDQYVYNATTGQVAKYTLNGEVECAGFGDGNLPLNYEGISFGGNFPQASTPPSAVGAPGCTSIYQTTSSAGVVSTRINYNSIYTGTNTFVYQEGAFTNSAQTCGGYISQIGSSTGTIDLVTSTGSSSGAASSVSTISAFALLFLAALIQTLFL